MTETAIRPARGMWFEDFAIGTVMISPARTIAESDLTIFGGMTGDLYYLHTDEEAAKKTMFGGRIAHGMFGLALMHGLVCRTGHVEGTGVAMIGWDKIRHKRPLRIGDTVHSRWRVASKRESKGRPGVGIVVEFIELINQRGESVLEGEYTSMVHLRPKDVN